jgi:hypothetical protein
LVLYMSKYITATVSKPFHAGIHKAGFGGLKRPGEDVLPKPGADAGGGVENYGRLAEERPGLCANRRT